MKIYDFLNFLINLFYIFMMQKYIFQVTSH